jgi:hypothetical protein
LKRTMLKKEDWGLLTITALLSTFVFPPYFVYLMAMAALTASAQLWTTRLSQMDQERFIGFEKEFRKGYKLEKAGRSKEALRWYKKLEKKYTDLPQAGHLLSLQIQKLTPKRGSSKPPSSASPKAGKE